MEENTKNILPLSKPDIQLDIQKWLLKLVSYWWLFLLSLAVIVPLGQVYLRYTTPLYSTQAKLLIKGVGRAGELSEADILVEDLGIASGRKDMDNEVQIIKSRPIMTETIRRLNANITYTRKGRIRDTELYKSSPILLDTFKLAHERSHMTFYVEMGYDDSFQFKLKEDGEGEKQTFGQPFTNKFGTFFLSKSTTAKLIPGLYKIDINSIANVAEGYKGRVLVEVVGATGSSSILELKLIDKTPQKAEDILNTIIDVYNKAEISDQTQILKNTITFIDNRMLRLTEELNAVEGEIERFKSDNEIITENASSSLGFTLSEIRSSFAALSSFEVEDELLSSLEENLMLDTDNNDLIPPNVAEVNPYLGGLINNYNQLLLEQRKLKETVTTESPLVASNDRRLLEIKNLIIATIKNARNDLKIPIANVKEEINTLKNSMKTIPSVEKHLLEKLRLQSIKENLFLFLLQKKEETQLSLAVTTPNTRIIESARRSFGPIFPKKKLILVGTIFIAMIIPLVIIVTRTLFETTIDSEEILKDLTDIPILGRISRSTSEDKIIIDEGKRTSISEMFRLLRTNLNYINIDRKKQIMLVTSSVSSEGKSVIALNLGLTIAISKKKVVVVDLDLRKPKIAKYIKAPNAQGVTNYLTGQCTLKEIMNTYENNEYFHYLSSGPIPPDPAELLMSDRMKTLIEELQNEFDYILLDSPPMGIVTDALLLRSYITNTLYVVRHNYTKKEMIKYLQELHVNGDLIKPLIVINDIKVHQKHYGYGGYNRYYGSGYYTTD